MAQTTSPASPATSLEELIASPFVRVRWLIEGIEPSLDPIDMTIGEPRHPMPSMLQGALNEAFAGYAKYPPIQGTDELRETIARWIGRRYPSLDGRIDGSAHILPLTGSREGLFSAIFPALARRRDIEKPAVLMPNPFYQAYLAAAYAGGAEAVFLPTGPSTGFLPELDAIPRETLERTAAFYLASPANPQGAVADMNYLRKAVAMARQYDFLLLIDECYSEVYTGAPPPGGLETAFSAGSNFANVLVFNSLSKRSNVPGLRSGFIAGDARFLMTFSGFRNVAGPQMPLPVQHASAVLWSDETHVEASRALYRAKFEAAYEILNDVLPFEIPAGALFLWVNMEQIGGGEAAVKTFWKECGVKVLPGAYLAQTDSSGSNPGMNYIRIALVEDLARTREALQRLARFLS